MVIDEELARASFAERGPDRQADLIVGASVNADYEVVGIVGDVRTGASSATTSTRSRSQVYLPCRQVARRA